MEIPVLTFQQAPLPAIMLCQGRLQSQCHDAGKFLVTDNKIR